MKKMKKALSLFLALVMVLGMVCTTAFAVDEHQHNYTEVGNSHWCLTPGCPEYGEKKDHNFQPDNWHSGNYDNTHTLKCVDCGALRNEKHTYVGATCTNPGVCACGAEDPSGQKDPNNHAEGCTLGDWIITDGEHYKEYSLCGAKDSSHSPCEVGVAPVPATCLVAGTTSGTKCSTCGVILSGVEVDPQKEHSYTGDYVNKGESGHAQKCVNGCGGIGEVVAHTWDDGEVTKEPTETEKGEKTFTCTACQATKTEEIPATGTEPNPPESVAVTDVTVQPATATVEVGKTVTLTATVTPEDATDKTVTWSSGDKTVATVDKNGSVTGVNAGEVTITATAGEKSATCTVTVTEAVVTPPEVTEPNVTDLEITVKCINEERGHEKFSDGMTGSTIEAVASLKYQLRTEDCTLAKNDNGTYTLTVDVAWYLSQFNGKATYVHRALVENVSTTLTLADGAWTMSDPLEIGVVCIPVTNTHNPSTQLGVMVKCVENENHKMYWQELDRSAFTLYGPSVEINDGTGEHPSAKYPFSCTYTMSIDRQRDFVNLYYNDLVNLPNFASHVEREHKLANNMEQSVTYYWDQENGKWVRDGAAYFVIEVEAKVKPVAKVIETGVEHPTLQAAVNDAKDGETVLLLVDVTENVTITNKNITLDLGGKTVNGSEKGTVLTINGGNVTLTGDGTITGGHSNDYRQGGGVTVDNAGTFIMESGTITNNVAKQYGGGVMVYSGTFTMNGGEVTSNEFETSGTGGGVCVYNCIEAQTAQFIMNGGTISGNRNGSGGGVGAFHWRLSADRTSVIINSGTIMGNTATNGGGVSVSTADSGGTEYRGKIEINGGTITGNTANLGGGVYNAESITKIGNAEITGNTATSATSGGGGVYVQAGSAEIDGATITGNSAAYGGGVFAGHKSRDTIVTMASGKLYGNTVTGHSADIYCNETTTLTLPAASTMDGTLNDQAITDWFWDNTGDYDWGGSYVWMRGAGKTTARQCLIAAYDPRTWYTVTYTDGVDGSELFADQTARIVEGADTPTFEGIPTREGYTFTGWNPEVAETVTKDVTYVARWNENTFTVTWLDGYSDSATLQAKNYGKVTETENYKSDYPNDPSRSGYSFTGWSTPVTDEDGNITITAQWQEVSNPGFVNTTYTLHYNANGGIGAPESQSQTNNRTFTISSEQPTREGYAFLGWSSVRTSEEAEYLSEDSFRITRGTSQTLYAVWTPEEDIVPDNPPLAEPDTFKLTVHYVYADGSMAAEDSVKDGLLAGDSYSVTSPVLEGYTVDYELVAGTMPGEDLEFTVVYTPVETEVPEEQPPLVDVPDEQPPLVDVPEEQPPLVDVPDVQPPLVEWPDTVPVVNVPDEQPPLVEVPDEDVPMAGVPQTGDYSMVWYVAVLLSMVGLAVLTLKKREDEEG